MGCRVLRNVSVLALLAGVAGVSAASAQQASDQPAAAPAQQGDGKRVVETVLILGEYVEDPTDAPMAVTVIDAEQRNLISANTTRQIVDLTPGVYLSNFGLNIRGVGRGTPQTTLGSENSVALYVDGFYSVDPGVIGESTLFGGHVEFQRGPQGTAGGRDAIGGAASMISRAPSREFLGEAVVGIGREGWTNLGVNISGPINDRVRYRLGAQHYNQPNSYQKNVAATKAGFDTDNLYIEFQLDADVTDRFHVRTRSTHFEYRNSPGYTAPARYNNGATAPFMGALVPNPHYGYGENPPTGAYEFNVDHRGQDKLTGNQVHIVNADYNFGDVTLYYTGGYAAYLAEGSADFDGISRRSYVASGSVPATPGTVVSTYLTSNYRNDNSYFTHELRLENSRSAPLQWKAGAFFMETDYDELYWEALPDVADLEAPRFGTNTGPLAPANPRRSYYEQRNLLKNLSTAVFGEVAFQVSEDVRLSGGLRFTQDRKKADTNFRYIYWYPGWGVLDSTPALNAIHPRISDEGVTARLTADWRPDDDTLLYASYARGYKASGFTLGNAVADNVTRPEALDSFEVGAKRQFGSTFSGDVNLFYYDYKDLQVPITARNPATGGTFAQYTNAEHAKMWGMELQGTWQPINNLNLSANYTYLNPTFEKFCCAVDIVEIARGAQDLSGNDTPRAPRHKVNLFGTYAFDFQPGSLILGGSVNYTGEMYSNAFTRDHYRLPSYTLVNATATWRAADNAYDLVASVTNLTGEEYPVSIGVAGANLNFARTEFLGPPRFYSLTLRYRM